MTEFIIGLVVGLLIGAGGLWFVLRQRQVVTQQMKGTFADLSQQALQANSEQVVQLAKQVLATQNQAATTELTGNRNQINQSLTKMTERLNELQRSVQASNTSQQTLTARITDANVQTSLLQQTTQQLSNALANPQQRGSWGERMAGDVLQLAGFIENVNYSKQQVGAGGERERPDFTFNLPNDRKLNMDVKFPLANYKRYLNAETEDDRNRFGNAFIRDVTNHVNAVASRGYINENTVDYVLLFIPNEQIYAAIHDRAPEMLDTALEQKIVLCSPLTLYAMLAVIRQVAENLQMQRRANEMANLIQKFLKQWVKYKGEFDKLGGQLETLSNTYHRLETTRTNQLERPIEQINDLRSAQGELPEQGGDDDSDERPE